MNWRLFIQLTIVNSTHVKYICAIWAKYSQICWTMEENMAKNPIYLKNIRIK